MASSTQFDVLQRFVQDVGKRAFQKAAFYRRILPEVLKGDRSVFAQNDLQPGDIIIQPDGGVVIVDWASAGWHPVYWEYATAVFAVGAWRDDWHVSFGQILDEYPNQYAWLNYLQVEMLG